MDEAGADFVHFGDQFAHFDEYYQNSGNAGSNRKRRPEQLSSQKGNF